jgi:hypothetical protein
MIFANSSPRQKVWDGQRLCNVVKSSHWPSLDNGFSSAAERAFYRYAEHHLRTAFPDLPDRGQFNRLMRGHRDTITAFGLYLVQLMQAQNCCYEAIDSTAAVTRDAKRRGTGWLAGQADIGWSNRIGWYEGFHLLLSVNPMGVITGFGFG